MAKKDTKRIKRIQPCAFPRPDARPGSFPVLVKLRVTHTGVREGVRKAVKDYGEVLRRLASE